MCTFKIEENNLMTIEFKKKKDIKNKANEPNFCLILIQLQNKQSKGLITS